MDHPQWGKDPLTDLEKDVQHLKECMETLHDTVHSQQDTFDSIEDAIHSTQQDAVHSQHAIVVANEYRSTYQTLIASFTAITTVTGILTALLFLL
jgi:t-SNARE complex subunit (syntaxin)